MRAGGRLLSILALTIAALIGAAILAHAVITSASNKVIVAGNGATTAFSFPFVGVAAADLTVIYTDAAGNQTTLVQGTGPTQYQVSLNSPVQGSLWGLGGAVTYNPSGTPIAAGTTLTIARTLPYTQGVSLQNQASTGQLGKSTEQALDLLEMQIQQLAESNARTITIPIVDSPGIVTTLPAAAQRANQALVFDGSGNATAGAIPASGTISAPMAPVVGAVSLAAGRSAFGLGTMAQENINSGTCGGASIQDDGSGNARVVTPIVTDAVNQSVTCAFHRTRRSATQPITYTLPRANTLFSGFGFWIDAFGGPVQLVPNAADIINAQTLTSGASVTIANGTVAYVWTDAANAGNWVIEWSLNAAKPVTGGSFSNLKISASGTSVAITADEVVIPNAASGLGPFGGALRSTNLSVTCNMAGSGLNGVDTGGPAGTSTWYAIWVIGNGTTAGCLASLSATAPTMPAGYTFRKRLGWALTTNAGAGAVTAILQYGRDAQFISPPLITNAFGGYWTAQTVQQPGGTFVPSTASRIRVAVSMFLPASSGGNIQAAVAPNNSYATNVTGSPYPPCGSLFANANAGNAQTIENFVCDLVLESTSIFTGATGGTNKISALGWKDNL